MQGTGFISTLGLGLPIQDSTPPSSTTAIAVAVAIGVLAGGAALVALWLVARRRFAERLVTEAREQAEELDREVERQAEAILKDAKIEAREEHLRARQAFEDESRDRRRELSKLERRIARREEKLDRRTNAFEDREKELSRLERELRRKNERVEFLEREANQKRGEALDRLQQIAGQTSEQAKQALMQLMQQEARDAATKTIRQVEEEAKLTARKQAERIISMAIQRAAGDHVAEHTVSVVELPSDDMKGRVIGREGRNIRAFELITGVNLIVDDTPEAVLISTFDPLRREIARLALEQLVSDGRIHPARIEEVVGRVRSEIEEQIRQDGAEAAADLAIHDLHPELVRMLGLLKFRTSYGQNVLRHSVEVATIAGILAAELGTNEHVARRAGLLHDIGKAVDHEVEGTHLTIGIDLLRRYGEDEAVIHGMEAHHFDIEPATVEAVLVQAADALSAARPGARRDMLETYVKRLQKLEEIADTFNGVSKAYAIQAGRELRIIVEADQVSDNEAVWLSKDIAKRIEKEVQYPGEIKVTVIRETRAVGFAR
ncbi:MAG TPA: ribonuclease Y [Acidobacteriota bacterium]